MLDAVSRIGVPAKGVLLLPRLPLPTEDEKTEDGWKGLGAQHLRAADFTAVLKRCNARSDATIAVLKEPDARKQRAALQRLDEELNARREQLEKEKDPTVRVADTLVTLLMPSMVSAADAEQSAPDADGLGGRGPGTSGVSGGAGKLSGIARSAVAAVWGGGAEGSVHGEGAAVSARRGRLLLV